MNLHKVRLVAAVLVGFGACDRESSVESGTGKVPSPSASTTRTAPAPSPDSPAFAKRALDHANRGEYKEAVEAWSKAFELNPKFFPALMGRAQSYVYLGEFEKAIADAEKAEEVEKSLPAAAGIKPLFMKHTILKMIAKEKKRLGNKYGAEGYEAYKRGDYKEAVRLLSLSVEYETEHFESYYNFLALSYGNLGDYRKSITCSTEAIRRNPKNPNNFYNRGLAYELLNEKANAASDFRQCIKIGSDDQVTAAARRKLQALER